MMAESTFSRAGATPPLASSRAASSMLGSFGLGGTGLTTGAKYLGSRETLSNFNGTVGVEETLVNNFALIGQEPGNTLLVHENHHVTVNADGTVTSSHDNFSITCQ